MKLEHIPFREGKNWKAAKEMAKDHEEWVEEFYQEEIKIKISTPQGRVMS